MMNKERFTRVVEEMKRQGLTQILIADDPAMVGAGGGAHAQNAPYV